MNFAGTIFIFLFFPICVAGYYLIRAELKNVFLLCASIVFYALGDFRMLPLLLVIILANYLLGLLMQIARGHKALGRIAVFFMVAVNFGILIYFKYTAFALENINLLFHTSFSIPEILLPLGISFITFRSVSYCLDVFTKSCDAEKNIVRVALYISFFPQVTMGPITKYSDFHGQFENRHVSLSSFEEGLKRIIVGMAKKVILANQLAIVVDEIFSMPDGERAALSAWMGIIGYLLQLYYDFSGYSDMAIGLGMLFGFKTPENFNYPYLSRSVAEFWARWHITLGTWLKDYIYTPVFRRLYQKKIPFQNKNFSVQTVDYIALFAVWSFAGIWHGADWNFVIYGYYYCFFIILERIKDNYLKQRRKRLKLKKTPQTIPQKIVGHLYFLLVLVFGQLLFRIQDISLFLPYVRSMFGLTMNSGADLVSQFLLKDNSILYVIAILGSTDICVKICNKVRKFSASEFVFNIGYCVMFILCISYIINTPYDPFLYANF